MERREALASPSVVRAEQLERPGLRRRGEREERQVRLAAAGRPAIGASSVLRGRRDLARRPRPRSRPPRAAASAEPRRARALQVLGGLAGLRGVRLVDDHGVAALRAASPTLSRTNGNFCSVVMMIRACSPASASASWLRVLVDPRDDARARARTGRSSPGAAGRARRRSVMTTTLSKTFWSAASWRRREAVREPGDRVRLARARPSAGRGSCWPGAVLARVAPRACSTASHWW